MTKEEALLVLNLPPSAEREEIDQAYQRLVRRYPPEFHPDRFRKVDEAYRFIISLAFRIESLLSAEVTKKPDKKSLSFSLSRPTLFMEGALAEIKKEMKKAFLWKSLEKE
jgi:curved DNA-binding protein CbpA